MLHNDQFKKFENEFLHRINTWEYIFGEKSPSLEFVLDSFKTLGEDIVINYIYDILCNYHNNDYVVRNILYIISNIKFIHILPYVDNIFSSISYNFAKDLNVIDLLIRCCENCIFFYESKFDKKCRCYRFPPKENYNNVCISNINWCGEFVDKDDLLPFITCIKLNRSSE